MRNALGGARIARIRLAPIRIAVGTLAVVLAMALGGCVASDPVVTTPPPASSAPLFATDADALKAAEEAYAAYLKVSDQILADGGANPERIDGLAVRDALKGLQQSADTFRLDKLRSVGRSTFDSTTLQHYAEASGSRDVVGVYLCLDIGQVDVINDAGSSVVSDTRPARQPFQVLFDLDSSPKPHLVLSSRDPWSESENCR